MEKNGVNVIVTNGMIWVNETHIEVVLAHVNFQFLQGNIIQTIENININ